MKSSSKLDKENLKKNRKIKYVIGIDEVGRGPVAGPVTVGACIMDIGFYENNYKKFSTLIQEFHNFNLHHIKDSKKLSERRREEIFNIFKDLQKDKFIHFIISSYSAKKIDELGIAVAIRLAIKDILRNAQKKLNFTPQNALILLDGSLKAPPEFIFQKTIIKGDDIEKVISCASIFAKVTRDRYMRKVAEKARKNGQIDFGFDIHKGYGTKKHMEIIKKGNSQLSPEHRLTFMKFLK